MMIPMWNGRAFTREKRRWQGLTTFRF